MQVQPSTPTTSSASISMPEEDEEPLQAVRVGPYDVSTNQASGFQKCLKNVFVPEQGDSRCTIVRKTAALSTLMVAAASLYPLLSIKTATVATGTLIGMGVAAGIGAVVGIGASTFSYFTLKSEQEQESSSPLPPANQNESIV